MCNISASKCNTCVFAARVLLCVPCQPSGARLLLCHSCVASVTLCILPSVHSALSQCFILSIVLNCSGFFLSTLALWRERRVLSFYSSECFLVSAKRRKEPYSARLPDDCLENANASKCNTPWRERSCEKSNKANRAESPRRHAGSLRLHRSHSSLVPPIESVREN